MKKDSNGNKFIENKSNNEIFVKRLVERRKEFGLTQRKLAELVGVSTTTIQNYENGQMPKSEHLISIAKALRCSTDWLLGLTEKKVFLSISELIEDSQIDFRIKKIIYLLLDGYYSPKIIDEFLSKLRQIKAISEK